MVLEEIFVDEILQHQLHGMVTILSSSILKLLKAKNMTPKDVRKHFSLGMPA